MERQEKPEPLSPPFDASACFQQPRQESYRARERAAGTKASKARDTPGPSPTAKAGSGPRPTSSLTIASPSLTIKSRMMIASFGNKVPYSSFSHPSFAPTGGARMPKRVDQYRLNAVKCFELAQTFKDPDAKRTVFAMADAWLMLANQRVKNIQMPASDPRSVPCPRCQFPMLWYSADLADDRRALQHSYECEKCGFVSQADEQRGDIPSAKRS